MASGREQTDEYHQQFAELEYLRSFGLFGLWQLWQSSGPGGRVHFMIAVVFHFVSTKFFRLFRCKAEEFFGLIHYCRKELQWRA